jgi:hypothetical protein
VVDIPVAVVSAVRAVEPLIPLAIECRRCSSIRVAYSGEPTTQTVFKWKGRFRFFPEYSKLITITALCTNKSAIYCHITDDTIAASTARYLLEYASDDGVIDRSDRPVLHQNVRSEIVKGAVLTYEKRWPGTVAVNILFPDRPLRYEISLMDGGFARVRAYYGSSPIPFSVSKFTGAEAKQSFRRLGATAGDFRPDGTLVIKSDDCTFPLGVHDVRSPLRSLVDLDEHSVRGFSIHCAQGLRAHLGECKETESESESEDDSTGSGETTFDSANDSEDAGPLSTPTERPLSPDGSISHDHSDESGSDL